MPVSVAMLLAGIVIVVVGLAQAADRSGTVKLVTLITPVVMAVLLVWVMHWYLTLWLADRHHQVRHAVLGASIVIAVCLFLAARSETLGPPGIAALGGSLVGAMIGNLIGIRRARRAGPGTAAPP